MNTKNENKRPICITSNNKDSFVSLFISYLVAALVRQGINAFIHKDGDELDTDKFRLFLVVFSEDQTFSSQCLDNLAKLVDFRRMNPHVLLVLVFYGVTLSSLKQQFCENISMCSEDEISRWRKALEETTSLQSHEYNEQISNEAEFVEEIARGVFEILNPTEEIGIHKQQLNIENLLCKQPWGLRIIGIYGKPGIGKTVLANAFFRGTSSSYDVTCFIKDFHEQNNSKKLQPLSDDYFTQVPMEKFDLNNSDSDSESLSRQKRGLFVLDDVQNAQDAMAYLGSFNRFSPGSLIMITSSVRQVLEECNVNDIYEVQGLNDEDALKLFTRSVLGNNGEVIEENLSRKVIKTCGGNPSTLISYAQKLKGNPFTTNYIIVDRSVLRAATCNVLLYNNEEPPDLNLPDRVLESLLSDHRLAELGHEQPSVQVMGQHLRRTNSLVSFKLFSSPFSKVWETYSKGFLRMRRPQIQTGESKYLHVLDISGDNRNTNFLEFVRAVKELNLEGIGIREIREFWSFFQELHFN